MSKLTFYNLTNNKEDKSLIFSLPVLFILICINIIFQSEPVNDEIRYLNFAENLIVGYYTNNLNPGFLWNGPGYPIILALFLKLKTNILALKILNSFFIFFGTYNIFKKIKTSYLSFLLVFIFLFSDPFTIYSSNKLLTEAFSFFLMSIILNIEIDSKGLKRFKDFFIAALVIGFLMLTKVLFAYVLLLVFLSLIPLFVLKLSKDLKPIKLIFFSYIICLPYLIYTFSLTGKFFYWSDSGGSALYPMTTLYENEYGDWFPAGLKKEDNFMDNESLTTTPKKNNVGKNHGDFLNSISGLNGPARDQALKRKAFENIKKNPLKYLKNIIYNFGRLSFRFPFSNRDLNPLLLIFLILRFSLFFIPLILSIIIFLNKKRALSDYFKFSLLCSSIIISLLLSAESRMLFPFAPFIIWLLNDFYLKNIKYKI